MQRWLVAIISVTLGACQTTGETTSAASLAGSICNPGSPQIGPWNGKFPTLNSNSMQVLVRLIKPKTQADALTADYLAAVVDTSYAKVTWGATLTEAQLPTFASGAIRAGGIIGPGGGGGGTWPPCGTVPIQADCLVAVNAIGIYAKLSLQDAEAAAQACN
jgi:hypothetical protein